MKSLSLQSPAKLNLYLKVVNKREDGYHNLITLFERIDLCDEICLKSNLTGSIRIFSDHASVPKGPKNLCFQAAQLLKDDFSISSGLDITIKKRIPVAAGLGGGSSNAATTLLGLNKMWGLSLTSPKLVEYAKKIGSDVPFFIYNCRWAIGTQRGDQIKTLPLKTRLWHVLVVPKRGIQTKEAFQSLKLQLTKSSDDVNILTRSLRRNNIYRIGQLLANDLETSILKLRPQLFHLKQKLMALNTLGVAFSGSGPSIFGLATSQSQAVALKNILKRQYAQVFVVRTQ